MGLACSNIRLLTLTARKADCEYNISIDAMRKMAITREQSELSKQYYAKLKNKNISYYANGQYSKMTYQYLMGRGSADCDYLTRKGEGYPYPIKSDSSMILTDYRGLVVLNKGYQTAIVEALGSGCVDPLGQGSTFSKDAIPKILSRLFPGYDEEEFATAINNGTNTSSYDAPMKNSVTGESKGTATQDNTEENSAIIETLVNFYYPIFLAASDNGWTTEYCEAMASNDDYISDALVSGTFQLAQVNEFGGYNPDASLTYFVLEGLVFDRQNSDTREEITAWYNAEKERISEKENYLDVEMSDLSTELEAINNEIQSVKSLIDDNIQTTLSWGSS